MRNVECLGEEHEFAIGNRVHNNKRFPTSPHHAMPSKGSTMSPEPSPADRPLSAEEFVQLKSWNTPTVYNGWEQITQRNPASEGFNLEETRDFMPHMGAMVGVAVTVVIEPSNPSHKANSPTAFSEYRRYMASVPGPKIVVVQDLDKPAYVGAFWGEVNSNIHRTLGCVGTITDGAIRDLDEMTGVGFKAIAKRLCVGHGFVHPVRWNCPVDVFGRRVNPGDLIHADKHGFLIVQPEEARQLVEAAKFMDDNEHATVIAAARNLTLGGKEEVLANIDAAAIEFGAKARSRFGKQGEF